jgi:hypothetical protein
MPRVPRNSLTMFIAADYAVPQDYTDEDEGILSLHAGEGCVVLSESDKGWSLIRTDDLDEGWFPTGFLKFIHAIVEVEDLESRISKAYSRLCSDSGGAIQFPVPSSLSFSYCLDRCFAVAPSWQERLHHF